MRPLLILRPEPGASATAEQARQRSLTAIKKPLFRIEPLEWSPPAAGEFDALLVTSANAVRQAGPGLARLKELPAYAVGEATASALRDAGFDVAGTGSGGVTSLLGLLDPEVRLLHLCGQDRHGTSGATQSITALPVYRSASFDAEFAADEFAGSVALVHSPRAGHRFSELVNDRAAISIVAISRAAAKACGPGWLSVDIAERPRDDALLSLAERLCKGSSPE